MSGNWQINIGRQFANMLSYQRFTPAMMAVPTALSNDVRPPGARKWPLGETRHQLAPPGDLRVTGLDEVLLTRGADSPRREVCLGTLLGHAAGVARVEIEHEWYWHRSVASARCLYPNDVYAVLHGGDVRRAPAGLYHYDPFDHQLMKVGDEAVVTRIDSALGIDDSAGPLFLISSLIGRTAHAYGDFAYRLCCHEAGMLMQNLCMSARSLGADAALLWFWESPGLEKSLPVDPLQELIMGAVHLSSGVLTGIGVAMDVAGDAGSPRHSGGDLSPEWYKQAMRFHQAQLLDRDDLEHIATKADSDMDSGERKKPPTPPALGGDVRRFWRTRRSGDDPLLSGLRARIDPETPHLLDRALRAFCASWGRLEFSVDEPVHMLMLVPNEADGWRVWASHGQQLAQTGSTPEGWRLQNGYAQWNVNLDNAAMCCVLIADYESGFAHYGNAAYRIINGWAGCLAEFITAVLHDRGLSVRCLDGLVESELDTALELAESDQAIFLLPAFGEGCRGHRFSVPYF